MRKRSIRILGIALPLLLVASAAWAIGPGPATAPQPRLSLIVAHEAKNPNRVIGTGAAADAPTEATVLIQGQSTKGWQSLAQGPIKGGRFRIAFAMPAGESGLNVRAELRQGKRSLATSPVKRIRATTPSTSSETKAATSPTSTPAPTPSPPTSTATTTPPAPPAEGPAPPAGETPAPPGEEPPGEEPPGEEPPAEEPPVEEPPSPTDSYWGAWIGSQFTGIEAPFDMNAVKGFEGVSGGKGLSLINFSQPFANCTQSPCRYESFPTSSMEAIRSHGAIPFFSWASDSLPVSNDEPEFSFANVIAGHFDSYIREFAAAAKAWGHPFFLRFNWEMNGNWFPWTERTNGNAAGEYVAAWRHVHDLFAEVGATNVSWVWCPYVDPNTTLQSLTSLYPGNEYVDWTGLDGYNWGPSAEPPRHWRTFSYLFGPTYRQITETIAPTKPMLVGETASSEIGGSKPEWIRQMFESLETEFPRIQGLMWFDKDETMDWPVETSPGSEAAFASGIADDRFLANSFAGEGASPIPAP
jgi:Glycosyl hydrolase family 26